MWPPRSQPLAGLAVFFILILCLLAGGARAEETAEPRLVNVGVYVSPPFVVSQSDGYSGMAIDLWEKVAGRLKVVSDYRQFQNYGELVDAVSKGAVDVAVTNLTITESRAKIVDFTHPWFDAGLRIMVPDNDGTSPSEVFGRLADSGHLRTYAWIAVCIFLATMFMTLFDRRFDMDFPTKWRDGLAESFYHVMSIATSGKTNRRNLFGWLGRAWQAMWMVCGIAIIAYLTSSIASVMTVAELSNEINSLADLRGKVVGVRAGSVSEAYVKKLYITTKPYDHIDEAAAALARDEVDAVVADSPVLEYFVFTHPDMHLKVIGNTFQPDKYGFAFTVGSPLTRPASIAVLAAQERGDLEAIRSRYFGFAP
ncbi:ABC transporter substrate-binding protein [Mesorhizobium soli]|uniref:ABC transporter substrate-binding protein n=2 Tax=Pseudaminobacter soli (ex Li et al. 2025) TaxID=1295366 RepID=A0A2P7SGM8_9HYPH|nr:transporter substrate-binding domain-containing protein [Mesorhizobium soli]PSJ61638.1 ABC transporter substrate-binding protein [Mesorhizobium soli]